MSKVYFPSDSYHTNQDMPRKVLDRIALNTRIYFMIRYGSIILKDRKVALEGNYDKALSHIATLRPSVDTFFDDVMVMVDDQAVRENRLALLQGIAVDFRKIADFAKL